MLSNLTDCADAQGKHTVGGVKKLLHKCKAKPAAQAQVRTVQTFLGLAAPRSKARKPAGAAAHAQAAAPCGVAAQLYDAPDFLAPAADGGGEPRARAGANDAAFRTAERQKAPKARLSTPLLAQCALGHWQGWQ